MQSSNYSGWFRFHRDIFTSWFADNDMQLNAYVRMMGMAAYKPTDVFVNKAHIIRCEKGELAGTLYEICCQLGSQWDKNKLYRFLKKLEKTDFIKLERQKYGIKIVFCDDRIFQEEENEQLPPSDTETSEDNPNGETPANDSRTISDTDSERLSDCDIDNYGPDANAQRTPSERKENTYNKEVKKEEEYITDQTGKSSSINGKNKKIIYDEKFETFWKKFHERIKVPKTDKKKACARWQKLALADQREAYKKLLAYSKTKPENEHQYLGKCWTYLENRRFENEMIPYVPPEQQEGTEETYTKRRTYNRERDEQEK